MILSILVGLLMLACACILVAGLVVWVIHEHRLANKYREGKGAGLPEAPPPPDQWTVKYTVDKKQRTHKVRAPDEKTALQQFFTQVRFDRIDSIERG